MNKDERFKVVKEELLKHVKTWEDWYEVVDSLMARAIETKIIGFLLDSMFVMAAFIRSLRDLPEEGDITVLVEHVAYILVYESKEKLGVNLSVLTIGEAAGTTGSVLRAEAARQAIQAMEGEKKVTLH